VLQVFGAGWNRLDFSRDLLNNGSFHARPKGAACRGLERANKPNNGAVAATGEGSGEIDSSVSIAILLRSAVMLAFTKRSLTSRTPRPGLARLFGGGCAA
jgi:hypothetical protein